MPELGIGAEVVRGIGLLFWIAFAIALGLAVWKPTTKRKKIGWTTGVALVFLGPLLPSVYRHYQFKERQAKAMALFQERCKTAGEQVYKRIDGVEGLSIEALRSKQINFSDQYRLDDPYGQMNAQSRDLAYVESFLMGHSDEYWLTDQHSRGAYKFVDVLDHSSGGATRYRARFPTNNDSQQHLTLTSERANEPASYVVRWADISSHHDRDNWIACGSVEVVDRKSNELLGKRTGCMVDLGLGSTAGQREPWAFARETSCPEPRRTRDGRALFDPVDRNFVEKVLRPKQGGDSK